MLVKASFRRPSLVSRHRLRPAGDLDSRRAARAPPRRAGRGAVRRGLAEQHGDNASARPGTLAPMLARPGPDVALVQGTGDYAVGPVRVTFLVIDPRRGRSSGRMRGCWVGPSSTRRRPPRRHAALEPIGIPGKSEAATGGVTQIYVARFTLVQAGQATRSSRSRTARRSRGSPTSTSGGIRRRLPSATRRSRRARRRCERPTATSPR